MEPEISSDFEGHFSQRYFETWIYVEFRVKAPISLKRDLGARIEPSYHK